MKYAIRIVIVFILMLTVSCQPGKDKPKFNFDFEQVEDGLPVGWIYIRGTEGYSVYMDSVVTQNGNCSVVIESMDDETGIQNWGFLIPEIYEGKQMTLSGYVKTENVTEGFAGLWMIICPDIASENMYRQGITGTTDWTKYEITLDMNPSKTQHTIVGGILTGKGKMWLDNLSVTIDGKDIQKLKPLKMGKIEKETIYPAAKDYEFNNGSGIIFPVLDEPLVDNLELLGRIWGFLKYHHPTIAQGNYNWDYELFRILPDYLKVQDNKKRDELLLTWIKKYGKIPVCKTCQETPEDAILKPDFSWMENADIAGGLKKRINEIYRNRYQGEQYYVKMAINDNPVFWHENSYSDMSFPDAGFRLLALYRYWNIIHYFFPYKYLCDKDWSHVLKEYIPLFISAMNRIEYE